MILNLVKNINLTLSYMLEMSEVKNQKLDLLGEKLNSFSSFVLQRGFSCVIILRKSEKKGD